MVFRQLNDLILKYNIGSPVDFVAAGCRSLIQAIDRRTLQCGNKCRAASAMHWGLTLILAETSKQPDRPHYIQCDSKLAAFA